MIKGKRYLLVRNVAGFLTREGVENIRGSCRVGSTEKKKKKKAYNAKGTDGRKIADPFEKRQWLRLACRPGWANRLRPHLCGARSRNPRIDSIESSPPR